MSFIKSRMNKDNFWNLMFWLGMTLFTVLGECFNSIKWLEYSFFCFAGLGVPLIIKQIQDVKFDKKYGFFINNGKSLGSAEDCMPKQLLFIIVLSIFLIVYLSSGKINLGFVTLYWSILPLSITLYFIYNNRPISIMFSRHIVKWMPPEQLATMRRSPSIMEKTYSAYYSESPFYRSHHRKQRH